MDDTEVGRLATRLREWAQKRGLTSGRSRSGVDLVAMAEVIGCSYEMARRYAEGMAMPKPEVVRAIANWLRISPEYLLYGTGEPEIPQGVEAALLEACIRAVVEAQKTAGVELSTERLAVLVAALYTEAVAGSAPSAASVAAALRALR